MTFDLPSRKGVLMVDATAMTTKGWSEEMVTSVQTDLYALDMNDENDTFVYRAGNIETGILEREEWTSVQILPTIAGIPNITSNSSEVILDFWLTAFNVSLGAEDPATGAMPDSIEFPWGLPDASMLPAGMRVVAGLDLDYSTWPPTGTPALVEVQGASEILRADSPLGDVVGPGLNASMVPTPQHGILSRRNQQNPETPDPVQVPKNLMGTVTRDPNDLDASIYINALLAHDRWSGWSFGDFWKTAELAVDWGGQAPPGAEVTLYIMNPGGQPGAQFAARWPDLPQLPTYGYESWEVYIWIQYLNAGWMGRADTASNQADTGDSQLRVEIAVNGNPAPNSVYENATVYIKGLYTQTFPTPPAIGSMRMTFQDIDGQIVVEPSDVEEETYGPIIVGWEQQCPGYRRESTSDWTIVTGLEGLAFDDSAGTNTVTMSVAVHRSDVAQFEQDISGGLMETRRRFTGS